MTVRIAISSNVVVTITFQDNIKRGSLRFRPEFKDTCWPGVSCCACLRSRLSVGVSGNNQQLP